MTSMTPMTRTATFRARDGRGAQLAERLLHAASLMAAAPGCELWLVQRDLDDADVIRVTEMWASRQHCDAALNLPGVDKHYRLRSGRRQGWAHRHGVAEEIYVALSGSGRIEVDEELFELRSLDAIRVAPASARELEAGPNGPEVLAFGSHSPGDGELVADWWTT
jgi:quinol monooxygenase YgiN